MAAKACITFCSSVFILFFSLAQLTNCPYVDP